MAAIPISNIVGSLMSGLLLDLGGRLGLAAWQWLFIIEAIPTVVLGVVFWITMTDLPSQAHWLAPAQRDWLIARLDAQRSRREAIRSYTLRQVLLDRRVLLQSLVSHLRNSAGQALEFLSGDTTRSRIGVIYRSLRRAQRFAPGFGRIRASRRRARRLAQGQAGLPPSSWRYVTRRSSCSAVKLSTPNIRWHITLAGPRTRTVRPPWLSFSPPLTRSAVLRSP